MISAPVEILPAIYLPTGNYFCKNDCLIRGTTSGSRCTCATLLEASAGSAAGRRAGCWAQRRESRSRLPFRALRARTLSSQGRGHPASKMVTGPACSRDEPAFPRELRRTRWHFVSSCRHLPAMANAGPGIGVQPTAAGTDLEDPRCCWEPCAP